MFPPPFDLQFCILDFPSEFCEDPPGCLPVFRILSENLSENSCIDGAGRTWCGLGSPRPSGHTPSKTWRYFVRVSTWGSALCGTRNETKKSSEHLRKANENDWESDNRLGKTEEIIGEHEVKFSNGKEIITLNHEAFDRTLYSEGALIAAKWLMNKKPGLYSMRDLMNFK